MPYADRKSDAARETQKRASRKHYAAHREQEIARTSLYQKKERIKINQGAKLRRDRAPLHKVLYNNALQRARQAGIEFNLTFADIVVPLVCPVFGIPLRINDGHARDDSPSLDRINPLLGYVQGNVQVISHKANTIKNNATIEDLRAVLAYMEKSAK